MKNSAKITSFLVLALLIGGAALSRPSPETNSNQKIASVVNFNPSQIEVKDLSYDFGPVSMRKGLVNHNYEIKNISSGTLQVGKVATSCMCTTAFLSLGDGKQIGPFGMSGHGGLGLLKTANLKIEPDQNLNVRAVFDPAAHGPAGVGRIERQIYLDFGSGEPVTLKFTATVTP